MRKIDMIPDFVSDIVLVVVIILFLNGVFAMGEIRMPSNSIKLL